VGPRIQECDEQRTGQKKTRLHTYLVINTGLGEPGVVHAQSMVTHCQEETRMNESKKQNDKPGKVRFDAASHGGAGQDNRQQGHP
jgi:hypothetical protein